MKGYGGVCCFGTARLASALVRYNTKGRVNPTSQENGMPARRDFSILRKEVHHGHSSIGAVTFLSTAALLGLGAGVFFMLPDDSSNESPVAAAAANAPEPTADESFCDKQAWPYVDQRCAKRVEAARGTRQVRIVTDKGHS